MTLRAAFAIPGDLSSLTGGYAYDREVLARIGELRHLPLPQGFPFPSPEALAQSAAHLAALGPDEIVLCDGLAFGALPEEIVRAIRARIVALVHHPLALETGLAPDVARRLAASEHKALAFARHVIVTSPATRTILVRDYALEPRHITVALPGTARAPRAKGSGSKTCHVLAVGSVVPRKGYDILLDALADCGDLDWSLTIAGSLSRAPDHAQALLARGAPRIRFAGEVPHDALERLYDASDLFVMPSHFEGYGMVLGEALVRGLPIVTTDGGALADTVPENAALHVEAGHRLAMAKALRMAISDVSLRARLADASFAAGAHLPTWDDTARLVEQVLREAGQ